MIIDQAAVAGRAAYLVDYSADPQEVNLALPDRVGVTPKLHAGKVLEVSGLDLHLEGKDLLRLLRRSSRPLLVVEVEKEMFPSLYQDPYTHRVHTIGGYEDFKRGALHSLRCMEVEGFPTLVSGGEEMCGWVSGVYRMPDSVTIDSVAWDLATSKLTPDDGFEYSLKLRHWQAGQDVNDLNAADVASLITSGLPSHDRCCDGLEDHVKNAVAYRLEFLAKVNHDAYLRERHLGPRDEASLGRPLLRSISLLEQVEPAHTFHSLHELLLQASDYHLYEEPTGPPRRLDVRLDVTASLTEGESIALRIHQDAQGVFDYVTARIDGRVFLRPPAVGKMT